MLVTQKRPRDLKWYHAGPLLFGDWGTSRLYVLGLALYFTGHAAPLYLLVMSLIMTAVAWVYTHACRLFPDGGGVYAAARPLNKTFSVIGATLLLCDYIVTAALSAVEGFHYLQVPEGWVVPLCLVTFVLIGGINWLGAKSAGRFAMVVAVGALAASLVIAVMSIPRAIEGVRNLSWGHESVSSPWMRWESLVRIVLALSGIEAVANMTGLMKQPVGRTAKRTIWPVLAEVVILNMVFVLALSAHPKLVTIDKPDHVVYEVEQRTPSDQVPAVVQEYRDTAMHMVAQDAGTRVLGEEAGNVFARFTSVIFGLLLLSAVNTAIMAMVSVFYGLAHDDELPHKLTRLNYSGVPWISLIVACGLPMLVLLTVSDAKSLAELYAIGVVGAITIEMFSLGLNKKLEIGRWVRRSVMGLGVFMALVEVTIVVVKTNATMFAALVLALVMGTRFVMQRMKRAAPPPIPVPEAGWLAELERPPAEIAPGKARVMLAARGRYQAEYAVDLARKRGAVLFTIYVRTLRLMDMSPGAIPRVEDDPQALEALGTVAVLARQHGVSFVPIYVCSPEIAEEILDYTVTFGCDTLIMGKSARRAFWRRVEGDVVMEVARNLPSEVALLMRDQSPYSIQEHVRQTPGSVEEQRPGDRSGK